MLYGAAPVHAQDVEMLGLVNGTRPPASYFALKARDPNAFRFSDDNGWTRRARSVAAARNALRGRRQPGIPSLMATAPVLTGNLNLPVLLVLYANTDSVQTVTNVSRDTMEFRLFGQHAAPPYTVHSYYREMSRHRLLVNGTVFPWKRVSANDTFYEGNNNGIVPGVRGLILEAVLLHDATTDFGLFDNDGPDNVPNSGDDDGFVDAVVVLHPEVDGSCGGPNPGAANNVWAHKERVPGEPATNDPAANGGFIKIRDYIIQGGQGGNGNGQGGGGCTNGQPQAMGVVTHEVGHLFDIPDLYDTFLVGAGIGHWGLMGAGNFKNPDRPAHMMAWTRSQLGWVTEVLIDRDTALVLSPIANSDTAFVLPVVQSNEYFLLENRQQLGSDTNSWAPGLLIWHIDSAVVQARTAFNLVNAFDPHGIALEQADGLNNLRSGVFSRGDAGDPFPGSTVKRRFGPATTPSSARNNGAPSNITVDSITQLVPGGAMRVVITIARPTVIAANDTLARFRLNGATHNRFAGLLENGVNYTLEMDSVQTVNNGLNRYTWMSWSNGQPLSHTFVGSTRGDTITATVATEYWLQVALSGGGGAVNASPPAALGGSFLRRDSSLTLTATTSDPNVLFDGWTGTVTSGNATLPVTMTRAHVLTAHFVLPLVAGPAAPPAALMGTAYSYALPAAGGRGTYSWRRTSGAVPNGLVLNAAGQLLGTPTDTGTFSFDAEVSSGLQKDTISVQITVGVPVLVFANVVQHLLGAGQLLTAGEATYLDLIGNRNGKFDIGDFLAFLDTGAAALAPAELLQRIQPLLEGVRP